MPSWIDPTPTLYIVTQPSHLCSPEQDSARIALQRYAESLNWKFITNRTAISRLTQGENSGRTISLLQPQDADDLYRMSHRHPTAAIQIGSANVRLDPSKAPSARNTVSLKTYVQYKAFFHPLGRAQAEFDASAFLRPFDEWRCTTACDGERDPRCIPLHVFSPDREWLNLHEMAGIRAFEERHGKPISRRDDKDRDWNSPNALHGREAVVIAGTQLRSGFHWDVVSPRGANRLCTSTEVWGFTRGAYCNIYPDGTVRQGQRRGTRAKQVYKAERPDTTTTGATGSTRRRRR